MDKLSSGFGQLAVPPHQAKDVPGLDGADFPWRDNAAIYWWDPERDFCCNIHLSTTPNGEGSRARCAIQLGGFSIELEEPLATGTFSSESISVDLAHGIVINHPRIKLEVSFEPLFTAIDWAKIKALPPAKSGMTLNNYQQGFRAKGNVSLDGGPAVSFSGDGWRDRTWGFREESRQWVEFFFLAAVFGDEFAFVLWKALGVDGQLRNFGWRVSDAGQESVESFALARDWTSNMLDVDVKLPTGTVKIEVVPSSADHINPFRGFWVSMGRPRQTGPTFGEFNQCLPHLTADGRRGAGVAAHGILRSLN